MSAPSVNEMMARERHVRQPAPAPTRVTMPKLNTIVQLAQLVGIVGGVIVVVFAVGKRDQILGDLVTGQAESRTAIVAMSEKIADLRTEVAGIKGELRSAVRDHSSR